MGMELDEADGHKPHRSQVAVVSDQLGEYRQGGRRLGFEAKPQPRHTLGLTTHPGNLGSDHQRFPKLRGFDVQLHHRLDVELGSHHHTRAANPKIDQLSGQVLGRAVTLDSGG